MGIISTKKLTKVYGKGESRFVALDGVSLDFSQGESIAIVGKSGSGKSTLMHILALLDSPTQGAVLIDGKDSTELSRRQKDRLRNEEFGFVFQQFSSTLTTAYSKMLSCHSKSQALVVANATVLA